MDFLFNVNIYLFVLFCKISRDNKYQLTLLFRRIKSHFNFNLFIQLYYFNLTDVTLPSVLFILILMRCDNKFVQLSPIQKLKPFTTELEILYLLKFVYLLIFFW